MNNEDGWETKFTAQFVINVVCKNRLPCPSRLDFDYATMTVNLRS